MSGIKDLVEKLIQENPIMIFSKSYCPYCKKAKETIEGLRKKYKAFEIDEADNGSAIQDYLKEKTSQRTVPNIFIDGKHVGGCDSLLAAKDDGSLEKMIANL
ncbi:glutaredoxin 1 [Glomus cerebriforme]|uniref:Glutaredoxin 1 n=1 Tax=Glomus cerebriforme TaxID=658196 RepID=A0A397TI84_9GLOM|nr:glutaredoxin 1 [Glomus cerebriforme]